MKWGICTSTANAEVMKASGWDYVEESVQGLLEGFVPDDQWKGAERAASSALPVQAANVLVPGNLKITGPDANLGRLREYMTRVVARAQKVRIPRLVFGSGGARNVPNDFNRDHARQQIIEFVTMAAKLAEGTDVVFVAEPLNRKECNIINSVAEAMEYVRAVNHPHFQCLLDTYHFWLEDEPLENVERNIQFIKHVHVADMEGRVPPGESRKSDYLPVFKILKQGGYDERISVEAGGFKDIAGMGPRVLAYLKEQWNRA
jgi:sugar phosphate isomerase/epimerase